MNYVFVLNSTAGEINDWDFSLVNGKLKLTLVILSFSVSEGNTEVHHRLHSRGIDGSQNTGRTNSRCLE